MGTPPREVQRRLGLFAAGAAALVGLCVVVSSPGRPQEHKGVDRTAPPASDDPPVGDPDLSTSAPRPRNAEPLSDGPRTNEFATDVVAKGSTSWTGLYGTLVLPDVCSDPGSIRVEGWNIRLDEQEEGGAPKVVRSSAWSTDLEWRLVDVSPGPWFLEASASCGGRWSWGVSEPVAAVEGVMTGPIHILLQEYAIEIHVTDSSGSTRSRDPLPWGPVLTVPEGLRPPEAGPAPVSSDLHAVRDWWVGHRPSRGGGGGGTDLPMSYFPMRWPVAGGPRWIGFRLGNAERGAWVPQTRYARLTVDEPIARLDFVLRRKATVSFNVARVDGGPLDRVEVRVHPIDGESPGLRDYADEAGRLEVTGVAPGECYVYARARLGRGRYLSRFDRVDLDEAENRDFEILVDSSPTVIGRLVDAGGHAVADSQVSLVGSDDGRIVHHASTDAGGRFELVGLYGREYAFRVAEHALAAPRTLTVRAGSGTTDVGDLVLAP